MARVTRGRGPKRGPSKRDESIPDDVSILRTRLDKRAHRDYGTYSIYVNEERAFSGDVDGLKPVGRRLLWTAYEVERARSNSKHIKSARIVGSCMGHFHPHGDSYGALVTLANMSVPLIDGQGNFGFWDDPPAASRYTESRLSKFAEKIFFDPFYVPVMETALNYDDTELEPVQLPALLPNILINGNSGIGVGFATHTPSFTVGSVASLLKEVIKSKRPCTPRQAMRHLVFNVKTGGRPFLDTDDQKSELLRFFKTGRGRVQFASTSTPVDGRSFTITGFAPFSSMERAIEKTADLASVAQVTDTSDVKQKSGSVLVRLKSSVNFHSLNETVNSILRGPFGATHNYDFKFTVRYKDGDDTVSRLRDWPLPRLVDRWIEFRLDLERRACGYWIGEIGKDVVRLNLLRLAIKHLDFIIRLIKHRNPKYTRDQIKTAMSKEMRISVDDAEYILHRELGQLTSLEDDVLVKRIKEKEAEVKRLKERRDDPMGYVPRQIDALLRDLGVG